MIKKQQIFTIIINLFLCFRIIIHYFTCIKSVVFVSKNYFVSDIIHDKYEEPNFLPCFSIRIYIFNIINL